MLQFRKIILKNADPCGDVLLDESLKHIKVPYSTYVPTLSIERIASVSDPHLFSTDTVPILDTDISFPDLDKNHHCNVPKPCFLVSLFYVNFQAKFISIFKHAGSAIKETNKCGARILTWIRNTRVPVDNLQFVNWI